MDFVVEHTEVRVVEFGCNAELLNNPNSVGFLLVEENKRASSSMVS
jgi:hypothetical protein